MAYAPHTNTDVQHQLRCGVIPTQLPMIFGQFRPKDSKHVFEYAERRHPDDNFAPDFPHMIYLDNGRETRLAKVLKTVAYVVIDEDENGPVIAKWNLGSHNIYDTAWVRA